MSFLEEAPVGGTGDEVAGTVEQDPLFGGTMNCHLTLLSWGN